MTLTDTPDGSRLQEAVRRLASAFHPSRIYMFGSQARGDATPDSDYDFMVVVERSGVPAYQRAQDAHSLLWGVGIAADVLVWTQDAFESRLHLKASLPATILREGKLLYAN